MGIGITGISKAKLVLCAGEYVDGEYDVCLEEHLTLDAPSRGRDGVKAGCYIVGRGGRTFSLDFGYAAYSGFMRRLSLMALGLEPEEVWRRPRSFRGKPFAELIAFADTGGGAIGPVTSAKLYGDFIAFARRAKRYFAAATPNVFGPPRVNEVSAKDKAHRNRMGSSSVAEFTQALGESVAEWDEGENLDWMWESYRDFRRALRLAKNTGILVFY
jgi:hypothetical protein